MLTPQRALFLFFIAITGAVTGTLVGPRIVGTFDSAPAWVLPAVLVVSVLLLALLAAGVAVRIAGKRGCAASRGGY